MSKPVRPVAVSLGSDVPSAHGIRLVLTNGADPSVLTGTLSLDPNGCSLNAFGDREMCTKIAIRSIAVSATRMRLGDPKHLDRSFYALHGEDLPLGMALIMYPHRERIYLKGGMALVPLFPEDGA
jgi:hypothetical protein